jgi:RNA polymerase sigma-70 factor (ECF subfamily)
MPEEQADSPDPRAVDPAGRLRTEELRRKLHAAMDTLPEHYRLALTLRYMEGLDYHGIEQAMGISNGAVRGILARTLQTMRKALKPWIRSDGRPSGVLPIKN